MSSSVQSSACRGGSDSSSSPSSWTLPQLVSVALLVLLSVCLSPSSCLGQTAASSSSTAAGSYTSSLVPYSSSSSSSAGNVTLNQTTIHIAVCVHGDWTNSSDYFYHPLNYTVNTTQTYLRAMALYSRKLTVAGGVPTYVNNMTVLFKLHYFNLGNNSQSARATVVANRIVSGYYGYKFTIIVAPILSTDVIVTGFFQTCETTKSCLAIAPLTITSTDYINSLGRRRFQYSFSVLYDTNYILESHLSAFRQNGLQSVAILYSYLTYGVQAGQVTSDTVQGLGMTVSLSTSMSNVTWTAAHIAAYAAQLQALNVQVLCILSTAGDSAAFNTVMALIYQFKAMDWLPSAIVFAGAISSTVQTAVGASNYAYMFYPAQWDWHLKGSAYETTNTPGVNLELFPATPTLASPAVFRQALFNEFNMTVSDSNMPYAAEGQAALNMVQKFIELAGAYDVESLRTASHSISVPTVTGTLQMDPYGRPVVDDPVAYQTLLNGSNIIIAPYSISTNPILPMPQFWERTFQPQFLSQPIEKGAVAVTAVSMTVTLLLIVVFIVCRSHPVMKASTPLFCVLMALGGLLMQSSVYATGLYVTTVCCQAQVWLLTVGFSMLFGALFMKTYRVWRIFNAGKKLMKVAITNRQLLFALAMLLSFDVILNIVWSAMGAFKAVHVTVDAFRPFYDYVVSSHLDMDHSVLSTAGLHVCVAVLLLTLVLSVLCVVCCSAMRHFVVSQLGHSVRDAHREGHTGARFHRPHLPHSQRAQQVQRDAVPRLGHLQLRSHAGLHRSHRRDGHRRQAGELCSARVRHQRARAGDTVDRVRAQVLSHVGRGGEKTQRDGEAQPARRRHQHGQRARLP